MSNISDNSDSSDNSSDNILFKQFTSAYIFLNKHPNINFSNDIKLKLYGTYKSATIGSCNVPKPSLLDFKARAKWDAWKEFDGISKEKAMDLYVDIVEIANIGWNKNHVIDDSEDDESIEENIGEENVQSASQDRWTYVSTLSYEDDDNVAR
ncbi:1481_t:CDS:2 [Diversispora eburnea]|uniref:1481_t:CDS:1 n=1 Tax=Diversispora eburnea TaxID=1213867 RepID=A0A9N8ZGA1_9GLOM|nr:1481_t:CDS:2 [Diversispora eburnea]